jgi:hydrogenase expression/formation protein HypD
MRYIDEFRDPQQAEQLVRQIRRTATRRWTIMEVCGGQTHSLLKYAIDEALEDCVELIHGPGCPVCVTPASILDTAIQLALQPRYVLASFGDMLRVPGGSLSLLQAQTHGAQILPVYAPFDAVQYAQQHPQQEIVFLAVGFETTAPSTALALLEASRLGLRNFSLLAAHVQVLPAMQWLMQTTGHVQAFLAAGHVCTVTGFAAYHSFAAKHQLPIAVAGFEPLDLLHAIHSCVSQLEAGTANVINCYTRSAAEHGNPSARWLVDEVYESCDREWRGFGWIPNSGLRIREQYATFDAARRFDLSGDAVPAGGGPEATASVPAVVTPCSSTQDSVCRAGEVLSGLLKPFQCPQFGDGCSPDHPLGAPMVSSEGACAAWFRYHPTARANSTLLPQVQVSQ